MSEADTLRAELAALDSELAAVTEAVKVADQEIKTATDRKEKLTTIESEIAAVKGKNDELRKYIETARSTLASFPTETQVLKLERRVESLKEAISDADKAITQHRTGVEAYEQRKNECAQLRKQMLRELQEHTSELLQRVAPLADGDRRVAAKQQILESCDALGTIALEREGELEAVNERIECLTAEDAAYMARTHEIKGELARELPKIDAEKDRDIAEIRAEFSKERDQLQAVYDKLFAVNKEQQFHLARGTHIKRVAAPQAEVEEAALSSQQSRTAAAIIELNAKLADVMEELTYNKKQADKMRKQGRAAHADFEAKKEAALAKLRASKDKLQESNEEAASLRNLKAELYQQLQNVRESPSVGLTPRRAAAPRQITAN